MSFWQDNHVEDLIIRILRDVQDDGHHFRRPFLTAYQLAIEFDRRNHDVVLRLGKEIGGADTGTRDSLAQYLALQLSRRVRNNPNHPIEGAFISNRYIRELSYEYNNRPIRSSLTRTQDLSMFRLR